MCGSQCLECLQEWSCICQSRGNCRTEASERGLGSIHGMTQRERASPSNLLLPWSPLPLYKIGRGWGGMAFSRPRNCPIEPFLQSSGALLILYPHNQKAFEEFFQEQNNFLENDSLSSLLEIQAAGNSTAASPAAKKIIKFCPLICMQSVRDG